MKVNITPSSRLTGRSFLHSFCKCFATGPEYQGGNNRSRVSGSSCHAERCASPKLRSGPHAHVWWKHCHNSRKFGWCVRYRTHTCAAQYEQIHKTPFPKQTSSSDSMFGCFPPVERKIQRSFLLTVLLEKREERTTESHIRRNHLRRTYLQAFRCELPQVIERWWIWIHLSRDVVRYCATLLRSSAGFAIKAA